MRPSDPRIRQRINQITQNLESANETAQEGIYAFSHNYIIPCFAAIGNCVGSCTAPCFPNKGNQLRRRRRGRAEDIFDFYDDWDNDLASDGLLGWGNDELDRLLAGNSIARGSSEQPRRQRKMSYGTRNPRRKSSLLVPDDRDDPTVIPSSSFLGFLERFPWRFGSRKLKYHPSAADLQEHPKGSHRYAHEDEPLMERSEEEDDHEAATPGWSGRDRSGTQSSRDTNTSLSSRGDLIPSDEEEDAVPLDDELAMALARRGTGFDSDDAILGGKGSVKRSASGTLSLGTTSSKESKRKKNKKRRSTAAKSVRSLDAAGARSIDVDLKKEEEEAKLEEESEIMKKRLAAQRLAMSRGLQQGSSMPNSSSPLASSPAPSIIGVPGHRSPAVSSLDSTRRRESLDGPARSSVRLSKRKSHERQPDTEPFPPLPLTEIPGEEEYLESLGNIDPPVVDLTDQSSSTVRPSETTKKQ